MIKTVLVPTSGSDTDSVVFETALAAARQCRSHLESFTCVSVRARRCDIRRTPPSRADKACGTRCKSCGKNDQDAVVGEQCNEISHRITHR